MLSPLLSLGLSLCAAFADDVPPGADLAVRVQAGEVGPAVVAAIDELRPLAVAWPQLGVAVASLDGLRQGPWRDALTRVGVDPAARGVVITAFADLADPKRPVIAALVRGVKPHAAEGEGVEVREVEGQPAQAITGQDLVVVPRATELVLGNERGVERLLRHLAPRPARAADKKPDPVIGALRRLHHDAPVLVAIAPLALVTGLGTEKTPGVAPLAQSVSAATLALEQRSLELELDVDRPAQRDAVASAVRGGVAAADGAGQGLLALGELAAAGPQLTPSLPLLPHGLDPRLFSAVVTTWMRGYRLTPVVTVRPRGVEARIEVTSWRGFAASVLALVASGAGMHGAGAPVTPSPSHVAPGSEQQPETPEAAPASPPGPAPAPSPEPTAPKPDSDAPPAGARPGLPVPT